MSSISPIRAKRSTDRPDEFYAGIPNKDLTEEEYQALTVEQRKVVRDSGLWDTKTDNEIAPAVTRTERTIERAAEKAEKEAAG